MQFVRVFSRLHITTENYFNFFSKWWKQKTKSKGFSKGKQKRKEKDIPHHRVPEEGSMDPGSIIFGGERAGLFSSWNPDKNVNFFHWNPEVVLWSTGALFCRLGTLFFIRPNFWNPFGTLIVHLRITGSKLPVTNTTPTSLQLKHA